MTFISVTPPVTFFPLTSSVPPTILFTPSTVSNDGGQVINAVRTGGGPWPDGLYNIYLGPTGTTQDAQVYPGVVGQGRYVHVANGAASFVTPPLPVGVYNILIVGVGTTFSSLYKNVITYVGSNV